MAAIMMMITGGSGLGKEEGECPKKTEITCGRREERDSIWAREQGPGAKNNGKCGTLNEESTCRALETLDHTGLWVHSFSHSQLPAQTRSTALPVPICEPPGPGVWAESSLPVPRAKAHGRAGDPGGG